ncbi:amino acid adenylation domain-containing protein [Myxococcus sp. RHSTA-1-4]|uniref:amino acid adenylation domain-containing protein n=1 Tax=Myxococcus sp. RHSTA-1-4 TaxID=2874601 RepID=UPI001CBE791C|nr:non-ribosomal peptide synthetase [Myxococcus sp. RHSTA-1-4]MBZ4422336.1 amino acid adenylation domain-containing protein [Myxococcus sp. RHSTA-1-4]
MNDLMRRLESLSPEKRELLLRKLREDAKAREPRNVIPARDRQQAVPLSFAQQRLWFIDRLQPGLALYNLPIVLRVEGVLDVVALDKSFQALIARHEVLRTTFAEEPAGPVQRIAPSLTLPLRSVDLRTPPVEEREAEAWRLAHEEVRRPFDLLQGPLLRATLLRLAEQEHLLVLVLHHIVFDIWSMGVLVREVLELYGAFSRGGQPALPPLRTQYADWAAWQRGEAQREALETQRSWWKERLAGLELLDLPTDWQRRPGVVARSGSHTFRLPRERWGAVKALAQREGATPFMVLLAVLDVLLLRYSGQPDVAVGTPVAGRGRREVEGLIGFFINTLVMRTDLSGNPSFREALRRVRETCVGAYEHQDVPLEHIVAALQPGRDPGQTPFYRVSFNFQNAPMSQVSVPGLTLRHLHLDSGLAKLDLSLHFTEGPEGLSCLWEYSADLFEAASVERMAGGYRRLVEELVARPEARIGEVELLEGEARRRVLEEWSRARRAGAPVGVRGHGLFEARAEERPEAVAVEESSGRRMTYGELEARANQLAHHLRSLGVGPEVRVGLCVERSAELVVGMLGVLKAGGAYVPIDPSLPAQRVRWMVEEAGIGVVLTQQKLADELAWRGEVLVCLDTEWEQVTRQPATRPEVRVDAESLAYVIFTSGSTGRPKGVMVRHGGLANTAGEVVEGHGVKPDSRVLQFASQSFDASVCEVFSTLSAGACLCMAPKEELLPGGPLEETVRRQGVTVVTLTPSVLKQVKAGGLEGVRTLISAGEACPPEVVRRWGEGRRLINAYGPTEVTVCATLTEGEVRAERVGIGVPLPRVRVYVLDEGMRPVPVGVAGELYVGGEGVARGYLGRPGLTAERFVPDALSGEAGARLYRTGDVVRWGAGGELEYVGRRDGQWKVRGMRLEVGEVEAVLGECPGVREAAVVVKEVEGDKRLVAYVAGEVEVGPVREWLRGRLPEYMVPAAYVVLEALPLSSSGKLDRKALPEPETERAGAAEAYVPPRTPMEQIVADLWAGLLQVERVGAHDNFFDLGGHSLIATQVASRLHALLGVELPLQQIFDAPTVEKLARRVEEARQEADGRRAVPPLVPASRDGGPPLSFAQQRLWFLDRLEPGSPLYNIPAAVRLEGNLDVRVLERCFEEIIRRHEVLRTTFSLREQEPAQEIHPGGRLPIQVRDLQVLPESERGAEVLRLAAEEARGPFDLARGPLLRALLLRLGEREHVLVLVLHHIVSDAWSTGILLRELGALYPAFSAGSPSPLPELSVQYADYATWQRGWLRGETLEAELGWWKARLAGAPGVMELPFDRPRPAVQSHRGAHLVQRLPLALQEAVRELGRREGVTPFMVLLAAFDALLFRYAGQEDIVVGTDVAGRSRREVEGLIGFFINQLVLRTRVEAGLSFRELLRRVRETTLEAYAHQDVPFEKLVEAVNPERSLGHSPIFQVKLLLQNAPAPELRLPGLTLSGLSFETGTAKLDLIVALTEGPEGLSCLWEYSADLFEAASVERMAGGYRRLVEELVARPEARIGEVELLEGEARRRVLEEWSRARRAGAPVGVRGHGLFEARAEERPEAVAVEESSGRRMTYGELEARANQLAHHLRSLGVGPEVRVGLCVERSAELVVGMLGVLKAGGAYVPIDPSLPAQRVRWMVEEAGIGVVLTQQKLADELAWRGEVLVCLDTEWEQVTRQPATRPEVRVDAESLAYVIFTSGSTGRPKGVMVRHGGLANTAGEVVEGHGVKPDSRVLQFASQSFDASVCEVFSTLSAGACLCMAPKEELLPGGPLEETVRRQGVTVVTLTPSVLKQVKAGGLEGVRTLISAGEACPPEVVRRWGEGRRLINAYGPTEVTVCATLTEGEVRAERVGIGVPLPRVRVYVLDEGMRPVPVGVAGELYVGGEGVARGYLGRPGLTAERFVPDALSGEAGARLYRTGDVVRWGAGGELEYVGRRDGQWKVRGMRLEVGEVEAVLGECPGVREAAVVVKEVEGDKRLVAYVAGEVEVGPVREWLRGRLPEYMVPAAYVVLEALPLSSSGKLDRKALPEPETERAGAAEAYVPPRTPMEQIVADLWAGLLQVERVGAHDNFFDLGGHSLIATQFMSRIGALLGRELALATLFENPTVAALAEKLSASELANGQVLPTVVRTPPAEQLPLSFCQEVYWSPEQGGADNPLNSSPVVLRLDGELDVESLRRGIEEIVRRHESLRTCFPLVDGVPVQRILPPAPLEMDVVELGGASVTENEAEALRRAREEIGRPFELARGPLVRCRLYRLSPVAHVLLVNMHHAITDFVSFSIFASELAVLYAAFREGRPSPLPELSLQYQDFTRWQHAWLKDGALERLREYWARALAGSAEDVRLPTDFPRPERESFRGESLDLALPPELATRLRSLCRREGVTLFMLLLAAFQVLLARRSGQKDVRVGFAHAQRLRPELERLIGMFAGYLVIRTDLQDCGTFRDVLGRVRTRYLEAFAHQGLPHAELVRLLPALCRIGFTFSDQEGRPTGVPGLEVRPLMQTRGWTLYDLKLGIADGPAGLVATLEYKTELFRPESVAALLGDWVRLLESITADVEQPLEHAANPVPPRGAADDLAFPPDA